MRMSALPRWSDGRPRYERRADRPDDRRTVRGTPSRKVRRRLPPFDDDFAHRHEGVGGHSARLNGAWRRSRLARRQCAVAVACRTVAVERRHAARCDAAGRRRWRATSTLRARAAAGTREWPTASAFADRPRSARNSRQYRPCWGAAGTADCTRICTISSTKALSRPRAWPRRGRMRPLARADPASRDQRRCTPRAPSSSIGTVHWVFPPGDRSGAAR